MKAGRKKPATIPRRDRAATFAGQRKSMSDAADAGSKSTSLAFL